MLWVTGLGGMGDSLQQHQLPRLRPLPYWYACGVAGDYVCLGSPTEEVDYAESVGVAIAAERGAHHELPRKNRMFSILVKLASPLTSPFGIAVTLWMVGGGLYSLGRRRWGVRSLIGGIGVLLFFSSGWVGNTLLYSLERRFPEQTTAA